MINVCTLSEISYIERCKITSIIINVVNSYRIGIKYLSAWILVVHQWNHWFFKCRLQTKDINRKLCAEIYISFSLILQIHLSSRQIRFCRYWQSEVLAGCCDLRIAERSFAIGIAKSLNWLESTLSIGLRWLSNAYNWVQVCIVKKHGVWLLVVRLVDKEW